MLRGDCLLWVLLLGKFPRRWVVALGYGTLGQGDRCPRSFLPGAGAQRLPLPPLTARVPLILASISLTPGRLQDNCSLPQSCSPESSSHMWPLEL